jgi:hypothetical protein
MGKDSPPKNTTKNATMVSLGVMGDDTRRVYKYVRIQSTHEST